MTNLQWTGRHAHSNCGHLGGKYCESRPVRAVVEVFLPAVSDAHLNKAPMKHNYHERFQGTLPLFRIISHLRAACMFGCQNAGGVCAVCFQTNLSFLCASALKRVGIITISTDLARGFVQFFL